jgi:hypothetical protein
MATSLSSNREVIFHPGTKGDASELHWLNMLRNYLPERYAVDKAFVLDCDGRLSDQIDLIIYDRQYSPFLFNENLVRYIPAESVYAVLEVRQEIDAGVVKYAGEKVASVRRLRRTSAPIPHAGGTYEAKEPGHIIGGVLTLGSGWSASLGNSFIEFLAELKNDERLDTGCALQCGGFSATYTAENKPNVEISSPETALISFFLCLVSQLRDIGTVPALDFTEYGRVL